MSADVLNFPATGRPRLRLVSDTRQECRDHVRQELTAIAMHLQSATAHFGMLAEGRLSDIDMAKGADELEAALFFALTLKGCLQGDRSLRNMLLSRLEEREIGDHG
ncbi:hypothetical protein J2857_003585 [Neorhizobium galegae]|uniref:hypothetical protein n=1 Tax=Neorhizobium galegae TaxID=399 RepID=UPI001AE634BF|nr:hypothetical protein [Neorhizobium galegae]MBP2560816.1 hypothetical protein [Neorhizobium galegae]